MNLQKIKLKNARGATIMCLLITALLSVANTSLFAQTYTRQTPYMIELDAQAMAKWALNAPMEFTDQAKTKIILLNLPKPGGEMVPVKIVESPVMVPEEAAKYPEIKTYAFQGLEDPSISGRLTLSPRGLDALMFTQQGDVFIEPDGFGNLLHKAYYMIAGDFPHPKDDRRFYPGYKHRDSPDGPIHEHVGQKELKLLMAYNIGANLRNYRMHVIADGEYSIAVCGANPTRNCVQAAIVAALNGMNALYIRDMAMKLNLTANTTIYLDPNTDPFVAGGGANNPSWSSESLTHHKTLITTDFDGAGPNTTVPLNTYDVAHLFSGRVGNASGGGGVAFLGVVCQDFELNGLGPAKAGGGSGVPNPQGAGWVSLLAHEFTHQYNADHTWNGTAGFCTPGQFGQNSSYEPGSGSTIVSYSGICNEHNIPNPGNINYYHTRSIEEANTYIAGGGNCANATATGNDVPVPNRQTAGCTPNYNIPIQTPFEITGSATDAQGGNLTFTWEEYDKGTRQDPIMAPQTTGEPLFRSFFPSPSGTRTFPQLSTILSGNYNADQTAVALGLANWQGELLPEVARTINLRLTVRDNNIGGGGVEHADVAINVVGNTPFKTTSPNGGETLTVGTPFNATWNVAGTTGAPISCANVTIKLSTDGGLTYPTNLGSFPNNGTASVTIPGGTAASTTARIRVECGTDCFKFFDISNANFNILSGCAAEGLSISPTTAVTAPAGDPSLDLSLMPTFGTMVTSFAGTLATTDPTSNLAFADNTPAACSGPSNGNRYDSFDFYVDIAGNHTFTLAGSFGLVVNIYQSSFNPGSVCTNWMGSTATRPTGAGPISIGTTVTVSLIPGTKYVAVVESFANGTPALPAGYTVTFTPPAGGKIFNGIPPPGAGFNYTYAIVNNATNNITAFSAGSDLSSAATFPAGNYTVHGLSYDNMANLAPFVGGAFSALQTAIINLTLCGDLSTNTVSVTITGGAACAITAISTANLSACNDNGTPGTPADDFFTADVTVTFANAPATGTLNLTGDGTTNVAVGGLGSATSHTFTSVQMSADGTAIGLTATFSANGACTFTNNNAGTAPASCSVPLCAITAISTANLSACNDNGTPGTPADDFFTADVTVTFANAPGTGTLNLTGDGTANVAVGGLGSTTSHTFTGVQMSADGTPINLTATFSANTACTFTNANAGTAPVSCSVPLCAITAISTANLSACNDNGTPGTPADDFFTADVTVTFANAPATGTLNLTGDGTTNVAVGGLGSTTSHTFTGVQMSADGGPINLTATFSANTACTFTNANAGTAPVSCSVPPPSSCIITGITTSHLYGCEDNGTPGNPADDFFTADVTVTFTNPPRRGRLTLSGDGTDVASVFHITSPFTFYGVEMDADGGPISLTATFALFGPFCTFTNNNAGTARGSCSPGLGLTGNSNNGELSDFAPKSDRVRTTASLELYQNIPNPFQTQTKIGFNLPEAGNAVLVIQDISGKTLYSDKGQFSAGYNEFIIDRRNLRGEGVLYYSLKTASGTATKKMILID